jgi:DNA-binding transcriptional MerR regulator
MNIGEVARRAGVSTKAVRYYESLGLLSVARRGNGYRDFDESQVALIREIHALGQLGIPVEETRPFLDCLVSGRARGDDCSASLEAYRATIAALDSRITELSTRRRELVDLLEDATTRPEPHCEFSGVLTAAQPVTEQ